MVIDAFLFTDELDLLDIRLNELDQVVDRFVIVESLETHGSTKRRNACLEQHWDRFELFRKKIKYVVLDHLEPVYTDKTSGWQRENFHRDALMAPALEVAESPNDLIIVSDCDEIPRASIIRKILEAQPHDYAFLLIMDQFFYSVNWCGGTWDRPSVAPIYQFQNVGGFQAARGKLDMVTELPFTSAKCAGWHFSSFCSISRLREKLATFAHSSDPNCRLLAEMTDDQIAAKISAGTNIFNGKPLEKRLNIDPRLPKHLLRYPERFAHFL